MNGKRSYLYKGNKPAGIIEFSDSGEVKAGFREGYAPDDLKDKAKNPNHLIVDTSDGMKNVDILFSQNITAVDGSGNEVEVKGRLVAKVEMHGSEVFMKEGTETVPAHISKDGIEFGEVKFIDTNNSNGFNFNIKNGLSPFIILAVSDYKIPAKELKLSSSMKKPEDSQTTSTKEKNPPQTNDERNLALWIGMIMISGYGIVRYYKRKRSV